MDRRRRNVIIQTVVAILPTVAVYSNEQIVLVIYCRRCGACMMDSSVFFDFVVRVLLFGEPPMVFYRDAL